MKQENSSLKEKLTRFRFINQLVSKFSIKISESTPKSPISLVLHWLGIGDIIVCGAILRGLELRYPDSEISFYLQSTAEGNAEAGEKAYAPCVACHGSDAT